MYIRALDASDVAGVTALCAQLGYPATQEQTAGRLRLITAEDPTCAAVFVAQAQTGHIMGLVYVRGVVLIEADRRAEVWALAVDADHRRQGVGGALMQRAEMWAREHGYLTLSLRSNLTRTDAHQFYQDIGYTLVKTSHVFHKSLTG
jgi:GNAT superfamily N-acetyltransferase